MTIDLKAQARAELQRRAEARLQDAARAELARRSFWHFRKYLHRKKPMKWGWWQREVAGVLEQFRADLEAGLRPKYVIEAPPQHGKSVQVVEFLAWLAGHNPDLRTIYASFSERLGVRANLMLQRIFDSEDYKRLFPDTKINTSNVVTISNQAMRNREIIQYVGRDGYFRNTTVRGSITGESMDLGVIDDPIKGRAEAGSLTVRDATWDWFSDDFSTRFSENAGMLAILTRWHVDDPIGRLITNDAGVKVFKYPAIATQDEAHRKEGEALFPEHKSLGFLLERKATMSATSWLSLYQQSPIVEGGEIIRGYWFGRYTVVPPLKTRIVYVDTAQKTGQRNDYSVFECWGLGQDGRLYLLDLIRDKWEAPELRRNARDFWNKHKAVPGLPPLRRMKVEDKASGTGLIQDLKKQDKIPVEGIPRTTDKLTRVMDVVGYIESGYVLIPENAPWVQDFITECEAFAADDSHAHDDQIDPMCDAITDLLAGGPGGFLAAYAKAKRG